MGISWSPWALRGIKNGKNENYSAWDLNTEKMSHSHISKKININTPKVTNCFGDILKQKDKISKLEVYTSLVWAVQVTCIRMVHITICTLN